MAWTSSEGHIDDVEFLLLKEIELEEVREELAERTDLGAEAKLAEFVISLDEHLILVSQESWVPRTGTQLCDLIKDQIVAQ